jgi:mono/diheme cytochrome c family protein
MRWRLAALAIVALPALAGCERLMRDMYAQPKQLPATASPLFADRLASRPPPAGSVAHAKGDLAATSSGRIGAGAVEADALAAAATALPARPSRAMLLRGRERYAIYGLPCHRAVGDGDGPVVRRGFPAPPSYHEPRLVAAPDRHFYDVISNGHGVMYPYADRVAPADRWAIVAYVRALQLSQRAPLAALAAAGASSSPGSR